MWGGALRSRLFVRLPNVVLAQGGSSSSKSSIVNAWVILMIPFFAAVFFAKKRKKIGMVTLDHDALRSVARAGLNVTLLMAVTCKDWREAIEDTEGGVFDTRRVLLNLGDTALLTELYDALALSAISLKLYPHATKRRHGGGTYKIFQRATYISIFHEHGGAPKLEERQERRTRRQLAARKTERV